MINDTVMSVLFYSQIQSDALLSYILYVSYQIQRTTHIPEINNTACK